MSTLVSLSGSTLKIRGDSWNNDVNVRYQGANVQVVVHSLPSKGFALVPESFTKTFPKSKVKQIEFRGNAGNDSFRNNLTHVPSKAWGGSGDDYLEGFRGVDKFYGEAGNDTLKGDKGNDYLSGGSGDDQIFGQSGDDTIYGGSGNDTIKGGSGNDNLYGDSGNDTIYGESGRDGLYGGAGADKLYGGSDSDRFLLMSGSKEAKDAHSQDATIYFKNGKKKWTEAEIERVDKALEILHDKTRNDNLLERGDKSITFVRDKAYAKDSSVLAVNHNNGSLTFYDKAFRNDNTLLPTVVHEIAHNFDTEHKDWNAWLKKSGWRESKPTGSAASKYYESTDGDWHYLRSKNGAFACSYGKTNPREDWATAWESYFKYKHGMKTSGGISKLPSSKIAHLDAFFASMT